MAYGVDKLPHILRNIPRILILFLILLIFTLMVLSGPEVSNVKGANTSDELTLEIEKTLLVIAERPDYRRAWAKLAIIYEQMGDTEQAMTASEVAKSLNPEF